MKTIYGETINNIQNILSNANRILDGEDYNEAANAIKEDLEIIRKTIEAHAKQDLKIKEEKDSMRESIKKERMFNEHLMNDLKETLHAYYKEIDLDYENE
jgi:hypothetical protein